MQYNEKENQSGPSLSGMLSCISISAVTSSSHLLPCFSHVLLPSLPLSLQPVIWMSTSSASWTCPAFVEPITLSGGAVFTSSVRSALISCRSQVGFTAPLILLAPSGLKDVWLCQTWYTVTGTIVLFIDCKPGSISTLWPFRSINHDCLIPPVTH